MIYTIRYSPKAQRDMDAVWYGVFEASRDYDTADQYINGFMDTIAKKKEFPKSGIPIEYCGLFTGFYAVDYKAYRAFYRIRDEHVEVLRIISHKQDYMRILFDMMIDQSSSGSNNGHVFHEDSPIDP